jgi:hypothetical protein
MKEKPKELVPGDEVYHAPTGEWCVVYDLTAGIGRVRLQNDQDLLFIADVADCTSRCDTNGDQTDTN